MECVATNPSAIHCCDNEFFQVVRGACLEIDTSSHIIAGKKIDFIQIDIANEYKYILERFDGKKLTHMYNDGELRIQRASGEIKKRKSK